MKADDTVSSVSSDKTSKPVSPKDAQDKLNQEILDSSTFGILLARPILDENGDVADFEYLAANPALRRYHGKDPSEVVGRQMLEVFPDLREHPTLKYYKDVALNGVPIVFESEYVTPDMDAYFLVSITRTSSEYITITFVEVSESKRTQTALSALNALSASDCNLEDYIFSVLEIGRKAFHSKHACFAHIHDQVFQVKSWAGDGENEPSRSLALSGSIIEAVTTSNPAASSRNVELETTIPVASVGDRQASSFIGAPLTNEAIAYGALVFFDPVVKARDYTQSEQELVQTLAEAVSARQRLNTARRQLEQRNEDLKRFATVVSHDLKAPMRHMNILSELLINAVDEDSEPFTYASEIQKNAAQAQAMIKALRDFSKLGATGLEIETVDMNALMDECVETFARETDNDPACVERLDLFPARADRMLLGQIIKNLLSNAYKYAVGPDLKIVASSELTADGELVFAIADNGPGINPRYGDAVFELFRRLPESEAKSDGEGVGLAACRKLIESLDGRIWLDTTHETGARFCFTLPSAS